MRNSQLKTGLSKTAAVCMVLFGLAACSNAGDLSAYLGVATSPVRQETAQQLGIGRGFGLTVDFVDPGSKAAGVIEKGDLIYKMDDQLLANHQQLSSLVRARKAGDQPLFTMFRDGKQMQASVTLTEKDIPPAESRSWNLPQVQIPPPPASHLRSLLKDQALDHDRMMRFSEELRSNISNILEQSLQPAQFEEVFNHFNDWNIDFRPLLPPAGKDSDQDDKTMVRQSSSFSQVWIDGDTVFTYSETDGKASVRIEKTNGEVIFSGPVNTDEEKAKVPEKYRDKLPRASSDGQSSGRVKIEI